MVCSVCEGIVNKNTKRRGTRFEYRVRDFLLSRGWTVFRSAGSHTCADLIAIKPGPRVVLVQCKGYETPSLAPTEKADLIDAVTRLGTKALVICRNGITHKLIYYIYMGKRGQFVQIKEPKWL